MSRRDEYLHRQKEKKAVETVSRIYLSTITEVLYEAQIRQEDIEYLLAEICAKIAELNAGFIDLDTYMRWLRKRREYPYIKTSYCLKAYDSIILIVCRNI